MKKCVNCNSIEIETDMSRGDVICTNCGSVLSDNMIISEVQFEEVGHGAKAAMGQFVSTDSKGGASGYGKFHYGTGTESREITLKKARAGITQLCNQLQLNAHCIDVANTFFKSALVRNQTRGRKNALIYAACVYLTCRSEGTSHLLIDISDALQICCYELGRTYLKLSQVLNIRVPAMDPCIYIMRFATRLEFGDKTHEVSMTAQRLVQRMKKDSIHSGRRPSGLCGAALLIAARMHDFCRKPDDIVKVVKIHESTLRKRLMEFGETPSSALTIDEFMTIDLEAEQDPPAFKAARKKDKERLAKTDENELTALQIEIDAALEKSNEFRANSRKRKICGASISFDMYEGSEDEVIANVTKESIKEILEGGAEMDENPVKVEEVPLGLKPDLVALCTVSEKERKKIAAIENATEETNELSLEGVDDDELDAYILTEDEFAKKTVVWKQMNAEFLQQLKEREEREAKEREEGKPERKKRRGKKKPIGPSTTAGVAIEKMLHEKKISTKINYEILKSLTEPLEKENEEEVLPPTSETIIVTPKVETSPRKTFVNLSKNRRSKVQVGLPVVTATDVKEIKSVATEPDEAENQDDDDDEDMLETDEPPARDDRLGDIFNREEDEHEDAYMAEYDY